MRPCRFAFHEPDLRSSQLLFGRIRLSNASAPLLPHITSAASWSHGQIPVVAMLFIVPCQDPAAIYGSVYNRSRGYKIPTPSHEVSHWKLDKELGYILFREILKFEVRWAPRCKRVACHLNCWHSRNFLPTAYSDKIATTKQI